MNRNAPELRDLMRRYILGTASARDRARLERLLVNTPDFVEALEQERARLRVLDALPDHAPRRDVIAEVERALDAEAAAAKPVHSGGGSRWRGSMPYAGVAAAAIALVVLLPWIAHQREAARQSSSENNLKQIGMALKMYASESRGSFFPPRAVYDGVWMVDLRYLVPKYIDDASVFVNPRHPDARSLRARLQAVLAREPVDWEQATRIAAQSYVYPGWMVKEQEALPDFVQRVTQLAKADFEKDIRAGDTAYLRHREGIERFLITDINNPAASAHAQSEIPVLYERVEARGTRPEGINVLYMDGHVEFVPFGAGFPATDATMSAFPAPALE